MRNFVVTIDGKQYQVGVEEVGASASPVVTEVKAAAPAVAPAAPAAKPATNAPANGEKLTAPFPGLIKELKFADGARVKKGDVVVVLEAMKMDNDLTAPCDGVITYRVTKGSNVDTAALLAIIG